MGAHLISKTEPVTGRSSTRIPEHSSAEFISLASVESQPVRTVVEVWNRWRKDRAMPPREAMSLRDLGNFAGNISLTRYLPERDDYEFRIIGDAHSQAYGKDLHRRFMSEVIEMIPQFGVMLRQSFDTVREKARPIAVRGVAGLDLAEVRFIWFETCYLPLGSADGVVDHILNVASYTPRISPQWG